MGRDILVDGYNIIKRGASFQAIAARNLASARTQLVNQLVNRYRHTPHQVIVVFDGDGASEQVSHDRRIRIIYSRHGKTADSVIARLAREAQDAGREVEMFSDDTDVRQAVAQQGGNAYSAGQLTDSLTLHVAIATAKPCSVNMDLTQPMTPTMNWIIPLHLIVRRNHADESSSLFLRD